MTEKEFKQCIAQALRPEYEQQLSEEVVEHTFSPEFEEQMDKLIKRRRKPYYSMVNTVGKRVAVLIFAFFIVSFTTIMSVEALRKPFLKFITNMFSTHSEIKSDPDDSKEYPKTIERKYGITKGVDGFTQEILCENNDRISLHYSNVNNHIELTQWTVDRFDIYANTENSTTEHIDINGFDAIGWYDNHNYYHLIWNNGEYVIDLGSNIGKDKLIEIAKSVQKVE